MAATARLNRPEKRNALSLELMEGLIAALQALGKDAGVRAIVIEGAGPVFSAGHDLSEMIGRDLPFYQRLFDVCTELMEAIRRLPQPVIAKGHGVATAAGCQLVAACDLAIATAMPVSPRPASRSVSSLDTDGAARHAQRPQGRDGDAADRRFRRRRAALGGGLVNEVVPRERLDAAVDRPRGIDRPRRARWWLGSAKRRSTLTSELDEHRPMTIRVGDGSERVRH